MNKFLFHFRFEQSISGTSAGPSALPTVQPHPHWVPPSAVHTAKPQIAPKPPTQAELLKEALAARLEKGTVQMMASEAMMRVRQDLKFKRKTVAPDKAKLRCAGGQVWYDPSIEDWDPSKSVLCVCLYVCTCVHVCPPIFMKHQQSRPHGPFACTEIPVLVSDCALLVHVF